MARLKGPGWCGCRDRERQLNRKYMCSKRPVQDIHGSVKEGGYNRAVVGMEIVRQLIQKGVMIKLFLDCCWWHESVAGPVEILCLSQHSGSPDVHREEGAFAEWGGGLEGENRLGK